MNITTQWLQDKSACINGVIWFKKQSESNSMMILQLLIKQNKLDWANWLIVRLMNYKQAVSYAIYSAEQVIHIFERKHPNDNRPRAAINAAKLCLKNPTKKNRADAYTATVNAYDAAAYTGAASDAAFAANASVAAACYDDFYVATDVAADSAVDAYAYAAAYYDYFNAAREQMRIKILKHGIILLKARG